MTRNKVRQYFKIRRLMAGVLCCIVFLSGCTKEPEGNEPARFTFSEAQRIDYPGQDGRLYIMTDNETGQQYLFIRSGYGLAIAEISPAIDNFSEVDQ